MNTFADWVLSLLFALGMALPVIAGNVMLFTAVPILAQKMERHRTFSGKEAAIMLKLAFFQAIATPHLPPLRQLIHLLLSPASLPPLIMASSPPKALPNLASHFRANRSSTL